MPLRARVPHPSGLCKGARVFLARARKDGQRAPRPMGRSCAPPNTTKPKLLNRNGARGRTDNLKSKEFGRALSEAADPCPLP